MILVRTNHPCLRVGRHIGPAIMDATAPAANEFDRTYKTLNN
jgi:hypothetical protein